VSVVVPIELMVWKPEYSMHIPELDQKARYGYEAINEFHCAMLAGKGKETFLKVFPREPYSAQTSPIIMIT
jgi:hypothetical protein